MPGILPMKVIRVGTSAQSRIAQACDRCRSKKIRCSGENPCLQCLNVGFQCKISGKVARRIFPSSYTIALEDVLRSRGMEIGELKCLLDEKDEKIELLAREVARLVSMAREVSYSGISPAQRTQDEQYAQHEVQDPSHTEAFLPNIYGVSTKLTTRIPRNTWSLSACLFSWRRCSTTTSTRLVTYKVWKALVGAATILSGAFAAVALLYYSIRSDRIQRWSAAKDYVEQCQDDTNGSDPFCHQLQGKHLRPPPYSSDEFFSSKPTKLVKRVFEDDYTPLWPARGYEIGDSLPSIARVLLCFPTIIVALLAIRHMSIYWRRRKRDHRSHLARSRAVPVIQRHNTIAQPVGNNHAKRSLDLEALRVQERGFDSPNHGSGFEFGLGEQKRRSPYNKPEQAEKTRQSLVLRKKHPGTLKRWNDRPLAGLSKGKGLISGKDKTL